MNSTQTPPLIKKKRGRTSSKDYDEILQLGERNSTQPQPRVLLTKEEKSALVNFFPGNKAGKLEDICCSWGGG